MGQSQSKTEKFQQTLEDQVLEGIHPLPSALVIKVSSKRPTKPAPNKPERVRGQLIEGKSHTLIDGRVQVKNTAEWPNSVHGLLTINFKDKTYYATGIMIGLNLVLTAGSNLYDFQTKTYADLRTIKFLPGMSGSLAPFGSIEVAQYFVSPNYIKEAQEDYGILILKEPIGQATGYFGIACLHPDEIKQKRINITGFNQLYEMWRMEGIVSDIDQDRGLINYMMNIGPGQIGSGVWYQEGGNFYVCGVHVLGNVFKNEATLFTKSMYQQIIKWKQQIKALLERFKDGNKLELQKREIYIECLHVLAKYNFVGLAILDLRYNKLGDEGATILASNTSWIHLSQLDLSENNISNEAAKALSQNTSWVSLSQLRLSNNYIGASGAKALGQNTSWTFLSLLDLSGNSIISEGVRGLAQNTSWTHLEGLRLGRNDIIGAYGVSAMAQNTSWINLSSLDLADNNLGSEGVKALAQNTSWKRLSMLHLAGSNIGPEGAKALGRNTSWVKLSLLGLYFNEVGAEGAKGLAENISWTNLSSLNLSKNNIGAEGAKGLAKNESWRNLSLLNLRENNIGEEGAKELAQNTAWVSLSNLSLNGNNIGPEGTKFLKENKVWGNRTITGLSI